VSPRPGWRRLRWYSGASRRAKQSFEWLKVAELVVGSAVPVVAALQVSAAITATLAALVVIAEGLQQLFGWQRDWLGYRGVLQALKREKFLSSPTPTTIAAPTDIRSSPNGSRPSWARKHRLVETHTPDAQPNTK
jgi:hypothetical protein